MTDNPLGGPQEPTDEQWQFSQAEMGKQREFAQGLRWPLFPVWSLVDESEQIVLNRWDLESRLRIISSIGFYGTSPETAIPWWHISVSHPKRSPSWEKMVWVKETLLGHDLEGYMVCPPKSEYVNINQNTLHWWVPMNGQRFLPTLSATLDNGVRTI